jgi:hypothetical protein
MKRQRKIYKDANGQPVYLTGLTVENNVSKVFDQLSGLCAGILADDVINDVEALFFRDWVRKYYDYEPVWPITEILSRVEAIFKSDRLDDSGRADLKKMMLEITGRYLVENPSESYSTELPLDEPQPQIISMEGLVVNVTGRFKFGSRTKVLEALSSLGAYASDKPPTTDTNLFIIGLYASRDWINTNYGRKIERAVELKDSGLGIQIISEKTISNLLK